MLENSAVTLMETQPLADTAMPVATTSVTVCSPGTLAVLRLKCRALDWHMDDKTSSLPAVKAGFDRMLALTGTISAGESNQQHQTYTCAQAKADGCSACPAGGCPMPMGHRAERPTDLLAWDETPLKEVDDLVIAESVFTNEFDAAPVLVNDEALHYQAGAFRPGLDATLVDKAYRHLQSPRKVPMAKRIIANIKLAYAVSLDDFVPSPDFICFSNGTLNVTTRAMEAHSPKHFLVNAIPHAYIQGAACPTFLTFLDDIWRDDADKPDKIRLIRQWMGYLLTADASQHKMLLLHGQGRNGKSVLMQLVHAMVGAGNTTSAMPASLHVASVRAKLARALLNLCSDLPLDEVISAGVIKATVAGEPLEASHKHKASHTVYQYARLMMGSNHLPKTKDFTAGYFDRLIILSFNRYFEQGERDPDLLDKLKAEMPGIVSWAVEGLYDLRAEKKLTIPPSSETLKDKYVTEASPVHMFVDECIEVSKGGESTTATQVFEAYVGWCKPRRFNPGTITAFSKVLGTMDLKKRKSSVMRWDVTLRQQRATVDVGAGGQDYTTNLPPVPTPLIPPAALLTPPSTSGSVMAH